MTPLPLPELADAALQGPLSGLALAGRAALRQGIIQELEARTKQFSVEKFGLRYHARMGLEGTEPDQFTDTVVRDRKGIAALAGIRFLGLDSRRPFVDLFPFHDTETLADKLPELCRMALDHYSVFGPKRLRLRLSPSAYRQLAPRMAMEADMRVLASESTQEGASNGVCWQACDDAAAFHRVYQEEFAADLAERPHMRPHRTQSSLEEIRSGLEAGLLGFTGEAPGEPRGFVLLQPGAVLGLNGFIVHEVMVFAGFRGAGHGRRLLGHARSLARSASPGSLVFAPIHDSNRPSLGAAAATGYSEWVTDYFIESGPDGLSPRSSGETGQG